MNNSTLRGLVTLTALLLVVLLAACGPQPTPVTPVPPTTVVAVQPTDTPVPPTDIF